MFFCFTFGLEPWKRRQKDKVYNCPRCSAQTVYYEKINDCFTFCFIPIIPCGSTKSLYECYTCGWVNVQAPHQPS
ncbi:hypothetical protein INT43_005610 [Umbelopsis isabellina]|uniref:Zinc-ribbon 15 domain-containing protein n=1 Tax=Mortierella isabellina TaxID=91625 RepID=A0A8H7U8T0_MORIS|nr:hypothetical protein INT43_005610 [Umbelopsis isabellina]